MEVLTNLQRRLRENRKGCRHHISTRWTSIWLAQEQLSDHPSAIKRNVEKTYALERTIFVNYYSRLFGSNKPENLNYRSSFSWPSRVCWLEHHVDGTARSQRSTGFSTEMNIKSAEGVQGLARGSTEMKIYPFRDTIIQMSGVFR